MKKRKQPEQGRPEFNNNPFTSLKKLKPAITAPKQPAPVPARKQPREDEDELFKRAMSGARRIGDDEEEAPPAADRRNPVEPKGAVDPEEKSLFLEAMQKMGSTLRVPAEPEEDGGQRQSPSPRMKQLKRGTIRISAELDLHGCLRDEALIKLRHFMTAAQGRGAKAVLVITGKGINSSEGPVLQGAVADWLRGQGKGLVVEFAPAPRDKGGSGAYVVFLKNG